MTPEEIERQKLIEQGRQSGLEEAAKVCDDIHEEEWARYRKTRDGYLEGSADCANKCADAIREKLESLKGEGDVK